MLALNIFACFSAQIFINSEKKANDSIHYCVGNQKIHCSHAFCDTKLTASGDLPPSVPSLAPKPHPFRHERGYWQLETSHHPYAIRNQHLLKKKHDYTLSQPQAILAVKDILNGGKQQRLCRESKSSLNLCWWRLQNSIGNNLWDLKNSCPVNSSWTKLMTANEWTIYGDRDQRPSQFHLLYISMESKMFLMQRDEKLGIVNLQKYN